MPAGAHPRRGGDPWLRGPRSRTTDPPTVAPTRRTRLRRPPEPLLPVRSAPRRSPYAPTLEVGATWFVGVQRDVFQSWWRPLIPQGSGGAGDPRPFRNRTFVLR